MPEALPRPPALPDLERDPRPLGTLTDIEESNGLLRQHFPKSTNLNAHSPERLLEVATELNQRPRKTLHGITPATALEKLLSNPPEPPVATTSWDRPRDKRRRRSESLVRN
jgi:hypothetical protein